MIDLTPAGPEWAGWRLRRWGRSRACTLEAPDGQRFSPPEILSLRELMLDVDYLRMRIKDMESIELDDLEVDTIRNVIRMLTRRLPATIRHRCSL